jgi:hypothetical protein
VGAVYSPNVPEGTLTLSDLSGGTMRSLIVKTVTSGLLLAVLATGGCSFGAAGRPTATPTLSSANVMKTAEAIAQATRDAATPTLSPTPITPTATVPPMTDTPVVTDTPSSPMVTANYNAYIRTGPDEAFDYIDFLLEGKTADVLGRYENLSNGTWWYIQPTGDGLAGWIWGGAVTFTGNQAAVPQRESPPTPTPGATATKEVTATATTAAASDTPTPSNTPVP